MKNKLFGLACILFVLMLFACTVSDGSDKATEGNNGSAAQGVVTLSFDVEPEDAGERAISVNNPDLTSNLIYQYKAVADFKLADGSDPVGATGDVWTDLQKELSFSIGKWTFDVRIIQKGANYETDKDDFIIIYTTESPLITTISINSDKFITFTVKKIIEGTGVLHFNVAATNTDAGYLEIHLYGVPNGNEEVGEKIRGKYDEKAQKLYFIDDFKFPSGFYRMTLIYNDGFEEHSYYDGLIEVSDRRETFVAGEIEVRKPDPKPMAVPFYTTDGKKELKGEVKVNKIVFDSVDEYKKERLLFKVTGQIVDLAATKKVIINDAAKKIELKTEKQAVEQSKKKVVNNVNKQKIEQKELKPIVLEKEKISYEFYCNNSNEPYKSIKFPNPGEYDVLELEAGEYTIGVKVIAKLSDGSTLIAKIDPEFKVVIK